MRRKDDIGLIHFVGIGGIGMSAIAEVLHDLGYSVQGSDANDGANVERLRKKGIEVHIGHRASNLGESRVVVASSAIPHDNPERQEARVRNLPLVRRAEMLAELMRFKQSIAVGGTHGKTTTTSIIGHLLESGGLDPTIINGGIVNSLGTNSRLGEGEWMVAEADESDGTFLKLPAQIAVVTNIDAEHLDHYGSFDEIRQAFFTFVENIPFYGCGILCLDHPEVEALSKKIMDRPVVTYGNDRRSQFRYHHVRADGIQSIFNLTITNPHTNEIETFTDLVLPMIGRYNVSNATAAIAVAHRLGMEESAIRTGLSSFSGVRRRFTHVGSLDGIEIFDDYGHHPIEIESVLLAARNSCQGRLIAIHQPHRYTRLQSLFDEFSKCFESADTVFIAPLYTAGESEIASINSPSLASAITASGHCDARYIEDIDSLATAISSITHEGDYVVFLGAGDITNWSYALRDKLAKK